MEYAVQTRGPYQEVLTAAKWAENRGLACLALPDHYLAGGANDLSRPAYDNLAIVAGLARETSSIRLSILVAPITFRHPAVMAKTAITIDEMSGGRFTLGVGTGWMQREHEIFGLPFPDSEERWERMEEVLAYLRAVFTPGELEFTGKHYQLEAIDVGPNPSGGLQIVAGGTGPERTPRLAGQYADEYNGFPAPPGEMKRRIGVARSAAVEAGRDPEALLLSSSGMLVMGRDDAEYRRNLKSTAELLQEDPDRLEQFLDTRDDPRGTPEQAVEILGNLEEAGIERFYVQVVAGNTAEQVEEKLDLLEG